MITYSKGNIFESEAVAMVNPVNTVGVMGKGLALEFKKRFPINFHFYENACKNGDLKIGEMFLATEASFANNRKTIIINFPTKTHWSKPSQYGYIEQGLDDLKRILELKKIPSIAIPALGCGEGGLKWAVVKELMERKLSGLDADIFIYTPH